MRTRLIALALLSSLASLPAWAGAADDPAPAPVAVEAPRPIRLPPFLWLERKVDPPSTFLMLGMLYWHGENGSRRYSLLFPLLYTRFDKIREVRTVGTFFFWTRSGPKLSEWRFLWFVLGYRREDADDGRHRRLMILGIPIHLRTLPPPP